MKTSTEFHSAEKLVGPERAVELVAKAGFDHWDFSLFDMARFEKGTLHILDTDHPLHTADYASYARKLRQIGLDCGITCNQSHAPFPSVGKEIRYYLKRAIECTAIAGGKICVIHPDCHGSAEENAEMYLELLPFAHEYGVKIVTENMWDWDKEKDSACAAACSHHDDFVKHLRAVNDTHFGACLDIGHAAMGGLGTSLSAMILALGDDLVALHISDNDLKHDTHEIPFSMGIDYEDFVRALVEINYKGDFTLESCYYLRNQGFSADNVLNGLKDMYAAARRLADRFEELSNK
jgi:sugar phosphate isomerase/epimerase